MYSESCVILIILLQSHGFEQMLTFYNLSKLGVLTDQEMATTQPTSSLGKVTSGVVAMTKQSSFKSLCRRLALVSNSSTLMCHDQRDQLFYASVQN